MSILENFKIPDIEKYLNLENFLLKQDWLSADYETAKFILKDKLNLTMTNFRKINREEWFCINFLWKWYSQGKFSYDIQTDFLSKISQTRTYGHFDYNSFLIFAIEQVGWVDEKVEMIFFKEPLTLENAPIGYFPRWGIVDFYVENIFRIYGLWIAGLENIFTLKYFPDDRMSRGLRYGYTIYHTELGILKLFVDTINSIKDRTNQAINELLEKEVSRIDSKNISQVYDLETNNLRLTQVRPGQDLFRKKLLNIYNYSCAVTGCKVIEVLDAAHIIPYSKSKNYSSFNGLILRTDIHRLFDLNLIAFIPEPDYPKNPNGIRIRVSPNLKDTEYAALDYKMLHHVPKNINEIPNQEYLEERCKEYNWLN